MWTQTSSPGSYRKISLNEIPINFYMSEETFSEISYSAKNKYIIRLMFVEFKVGISGFKRVSGSYTKHINIQWKIPDINTSSIHIPLNTFIYNFSAWLLYDGMCRFFRMQSVFSPIFYPHLRRSCMIESVSKRYENQIVYFTVVLSWRHLNISLFNPLDVKLFFRVRLPTSIHADITLNLYNPVISKITFDQTTDELLYYSYCC